MNRLLIILVMSALSMASMAQADIYAALSKGDVSALEQHLDTQVELCIFDKEDVFDRQNAAKMLREFFATHTVKGYKEMHSGASKGRDSNYAIGQLATDKGTFRVYLYFDKREDKRIIQELRIEHNR